MYAFLGWTKRIALAVAILGVFYVIADHSINKNRISLGGQSNTWTFGAAPSNGAGAEVCTYFDPAPSAFTSQQLGQVRCDANQIAMVDVTAGAVQIAQNSSGNTIPITCDNSVAINISAPGTLQTTQIVPLATSKTIYVCGFNFQTSAATNVMFETSTTAACASGTTALTGPYNGGPQAGVSDESPFFNGMKSSVSGAICIVTVGTAGQVSGILKYTQF